MSEILDFRRSVPDAIASVLLDRIMAGELRSGDPLREAELAGEFGISRNTVRESFIRLQHDGVARKHPHRGCRVVDPDPDEIRQIFSVRRVVEPGALRHLALDADPALAIRELETLAGAMEDAAADGDWARYGGLDLRFHTQLCRLAGGPRLGTMFQRTVRPLFIYLLAVDEAQAGDSNDPHVREHRVLCDLIRDGETAEALELIDRHIDAAEVAVLGSARPGDGG